MKENKKLNGVEQVETPRSPIDLWKLMGGKAQRVKSSQMPAQDSLLAVYKDRFTYTFILGKEVASIHFDKTKGEIFFKGHNIKNSELNPEQLMALDGLKTILTQDQRAKHLLSDYQATLGRFIADKYK
ncbi:MAG: hypothetical protein A3F82_00795 [Deltaproteobacteria bacterium RIFCSPLOWO2_12_FULL_44_12]|nr:MAG: hypothetical protein A2712_04160 [Deltaproteobacteria bacterium RIFCSPHIGHO2_01_FULL_43_49]OGQ16379.1 MAG: hypothetical protein A3D22_02130 [Deltaproteobacteria bacterium RIFCSPHIGHO2_02_FULL_44_53]OGQ27795.1 MAG: hypothetical protein A3D98_08860 [Deltaproteobacteria bacterium RIFCSPHIGHO2_12_FULL_44_21]OGQ32897.1 MAG: hypothetical protein A2979_10060 [Deltaproteobacteria bacterium RIFCSPLOWO2_01_FULL_45_74]OGQ41998.1 MAG: hypothetical protein A3I70_09845 [Deltaproteobacteria bacterium 